MYKEQFDAKIAALQADVQAAYKDLQSGKITEARFNHVTDRAEAETEKLNTAFQSRMKANSMNWAGNSAEYNRANGMLAGSMAGGWPANCKVKQVSDVPKGAVQVTRGLSPADLDPDSLRALHQAMETRTPFTVNIKSAPGQSGGFASRAGNKAIASSPLTESVPSFSGLLPPVLRPDIPVNFLYDNEPRIADLIPTLEIEDQEIGIPIEGQPTNPTVPTVSELGSLGDIGANWSTKVWRPIKLAVLGSISEELIMDQGIFSQLIPTTMASALYSAESQQILYGNGSAPNMQGLSGYPGIISLPAESFMYTPATDTLIDAFVNASAALRETVNFYQPATLILLNPSDWSGIKRLKNTLGDYILSTINPNVVLADIDNIMGIRVVETTHVNPGEAFVLNPEASLRYIQRSGLQVGFNNFADTYWGNMEVGWRVFTRSVLAVTRPQGVIHMTSLAILRQLIMAFVTNPTTGNYGVDVDGSVKIPAPQPAPGFRLATQTKPLPVVFEGWVSGGAFNTDNVIGLRPGESLQAFYPEPLFIPESAGESPGDGYVYTVIRVVTSGGWLSDIARYGYDGW